ncbi:hypothetical protein SVIOM342S_06876 [Streptomyces violaceorubidus]
MFSTTPSCTIASVPSRVMTRPSSTTDRYAGFSCTRTSRSGISSSRAVDRRITPSRCTVPDSSTYPRGSSKGNSVCNCCLGAVSTGGPAEGRPENRPAPPWARRREPNGEVRSRRRGLGCRGGCLGSTTAHYSTTSSSNTMVMVSVSALVSPAFRVPATTLLHQALRRFQRLTGLSS